MFCVQKVNFMEYASCFFDHQLSCTRTQTDTVIIPSRKDIPTDFLQESIWKTKSYSGKILRPFQATFSWTHLSFSFPFIALKGCTEVLGGLSDLWEGFQSQTIGSIRGARHIHLADKVSQKFVPLGSARIPVPQHIIWQAFALLAISCQPSVCSRMGHRVYGGCCPTSLTKTTTTTSLTNR